MVGVGAFLLYEAYKGNVHPVKKAVRAAKGG